MKRNHAPHTQKNKLPKIERDIMNVIPDTDERTLVSYPFPLENGLMARLYIPLDLTKEEAQRLIKYIEVLAEPI